jgi:predicted nucleic acid-binding Zn finger protein
VVILTLESIIFPIYYPRECQNLFLGSIPGIPIIILVSLAVLAVRKREVNFDELESFEAARMKQAFSDVDTYRETEFSKVLQNIESFGDSLPVDSINESQLERINLEIQKIQTFLVCSEYMDSALIRELFEFVRERQSRGILGRISIFGDNFEEVAAKIDSQRLIKEIRTILGKAPANITLIKGALLEIQIEGEGLQEGKGNFEVEGVRLTFQQP